MAKEVAQLEFQVDVILSDAADDSLCMAAIFEDYEKGSLFIAQKVCARTIFGHLLWDFEYIYKLSLLRNFEDFTIMSRQSRHADYCTKILDLTFLY